MTKKLTHVYYLLVILTSIEPLTLKQIIHNCGYTLCGYINYGANNDLNSTINPSKELKQQNNTKRS